MLTLAIGYGSAFGFTDLSSPAVAMHIHGPAPTNLTASVLISLASLHIPATNPAAGGTIIGSVAYTADQAAALFAGSNYVNIHTAVNPGGEIRAQLIPVTNSAPTVVCAGSTNLECEGSGGRLVGISAQVADPAGLAMSVVWAVDGVPVQTNDVPAAAPATASFVTLSAFLTVGQHTVVVSAANTSGASSSCSTTIGIVDTLPPVIVSASASPNVLWPPNHKWVPVNISIVATDICSSATCRIRSVRSDEESKGHRPRGTGQWSITADTSLNLRAERLGNGDGRTYTITMECTDAAGNTSTREVIVSVPHDQGKGKKNGKNKDHKGKDDNQGDDDDNSSNGKSNGKAKGKG
jgi:hypothetical protein